MRLFFFFYNLFYYPPLLSFNQRFLSVVYPFKPKLTLFVAKATIGMIWLLALVIMFPSVLMLTIQQERSHFMVQDDNYNLTYPLYSCYEAWPEPELRKVYTTVLFALIYLIPLILIVLYVWPHWS